MDCAVLQTNHAHCGACFHACNADQQCVAGRCNPPVQCPTGQTACNERCVDTQTNPEHCGACRHQCTIGGGFVGRCVAGQCQGR